MVTCFAMSVQSHSPQFQDPLITILMGPIGPTMYIWTHGRGVCGKLLGGQPNHLYTPSVYGGSSTPSSLLTFHFPLHVAPRNMATWLLIQHRKPSWRPVSSDTSLLTTEILRLFPRLLHQQVHRQRMKTWKRRSLTWMINQWKRGS